MALPCSPLVLDACIATIAELTGASNRDIMQMILDKVSVPRVTKDNVEAGDYTFVAYFPRGGPSQRFLVVPTSREEAIQHATLRIQAKYGLDAPIDASRKHGSNLSLYPRNYVREARDLVHEDNQ